MKDIKLSQFGEIDLDSNSDFALISGEELILQNVKMRLITPLQGLFYDKTFGSGVFDLIQSIWNKSSISALEESVVVGLKSDPDIESNSISVDICLKGEEVIVDVNFKILSFDKYSEISFTIDKNGILVN
ncbi:MAG: hypothetical protein ACRCTQ_05140 [Brevinemataceae bacterium]